MFWKRTFMWLAAAGILVVVTGACGVKAVAPSGTTGGASDSGQVAGGPKAVLGENDLTETAFSHKIEDGNKPVAEGPLQSNESAHPPRPADVKTEDQGVGPGMILQDPSRYGSGAVTVRGVFLGWRGPCRGGPPVSRSDWMIGDTSGCLYVSGPIPPGLNPARPSNELISVTGTVRMKNNIPYLDTGP
ncbi:MAG: hypothetical protein AB1724_07905 [Thermodesulfobacteriota bacterium]